ncbi:MAG: Mur ligase domain-containing protein [Chloroflexota bacterium]
MSGEVERLVAAAAEHAPMTLDALEAELRGRGLLLEVVERPNGAADDQADVTGVAEDSRVIRTGMLFVAVPGFHVDGHEYVAKAAAAGASGRTCPHPTRI